MVNHDEYPNFPQLECSACNERFEVPRKAVVTATFGDQILIDWNAADLLMKAHHDLHKDDLIQGVEDYLRANS